MKFSNSLVVAVGFGLGVDAHTIFQRVSVNGKDAGLLTGLRAPNNNFPVQDVTSNDIICGQAGSTSQTVVSVAAGDKVGAQYQHVIGGPQSTTDSDNPIAITHKGPVMAYLAKVDDAASASASGLRWFKIWEDGLDTGSGSHEWGIDRMRTNGGWVHFEMPQCVAPGDYLLRVEALALHSAGNVGGAQSYTSCAQLKVTGSGSLSPSTVAFPGAYSANDPGILINIYGNSGQADNNGKAYTPPGPRPITC